MKPLPTRPIHPLLKYTLLLILAIILGALAGWLITDYLDITSNTALNTIRVTWILGIFIGFAAGRYTKK